MMFRQLSDRIRHPTLKVALVAILLVVLIPTLGVVAMALMNAGSSIRTLSEQRLQETAHILAQSTASEIEVTGRLLHGLQGGKAGTAGTEGEGRYQLISLTRAADGSIAPPGLLEPALADLAVKAAESGLLQVSNFLPARYDGDAPRIAIAYPGADPAPGEGDSAVISVAILDGHPSALIRALTRLSEVAGGPVLAITDGNGRIIGRSVDGDRLIGKPVPDWAALTALGTTSGTFRARTLEGRAIVFAFQHIMGTPGWVAVVGEPVLSFDARWENPIRTMILASAATIVVAFALALLLVRRVLAPIRGLVDRSRSISGAAGASEEPVEIPPARIREFETLRQSLNQAETELRSRLAESRAAEAQARNSFEAMERAERLARIGSWTLHLDSGAFTFSEMMAEMNGFSRDSNITVEDLRQMMPAADFERVGAAIGRCLETGEPYMVDVVHYAPGGGSFAAEIRGGAIPGADGCPVALSGTVQDVSEREAARAQMAAIADSLPNGAIYRIDFLAPELGLGGTDATRLQMRFSYISAGVGKLLGISAEELMADPSRFVLAVHPDDREHYLETSRRATAAGVNFECEFRLIKPEGETAWIQVRSAPRASEKGRVWDGIILDVTPAHETAEALRTAKEDAEAAERAKSDFLATMSHEIRTPMNSVIGMTRLALQTQLEPKQRSYLEKINGSANVLLGIINDILDYSKIEAGGMLLENTVFRLESVLESVSAVTALRAEEKGLELTFAIAPGTPVQWRGDSLRLAQVLNNLVGNAVKFTSAGDVVVSVCALPETSDGAQQLFFTVRDTGIGMSQDQIDGLFRPFTQADSDTARKYGGTGLGLAISRRIVELMGGRIWVESAPGEGSSFCFTVELGAVSGEAQPGGPAWLSSGLGERRVLIVDDNETARIALTEMVSGFGMGAVTAAGGEEALRLLRRADSSGEPFDIVLSDWRMPGMDGLELARHIREDERLENMPAVLMVTAYGHQLVLSEAEKIGLQGVLLKPVTRSMVFNTVLEVLAIAPPDHEMESSRRPVPKISENLDLTSVLSGREVLVVDDNALNREVAGEFLDLVGIRVQTAENGREAIQCMEEKRFDAVLMDVHMPVMNGLEAIREIRKRPEWADLPVIALTAQARVEDQRASMDAGMSAHLTKPLDEQQLYQLLAGFFGATPRPAESPANAGRSGIATPYKADLTKLLKRFGGSQDRLLRFINGFLRDFGDMAERFEEMQAEEDITRIAEFAHRVKGVVGYLEADALFATAGSLEHSARLGDAGSVLAAAPRFTRLMRECLTGLDALLSEIAPEPSPSIPLSLTLHEARERVESLLPLVSGGDFSARAGLEALVAGLAGFGLAEQATEALDAFDDLDLDRATGTLRALGATLAARPPGAGA